MDADVMEELKPHPRPLFWHKPEKASCGLGKGAFTSFVGTNPNSLVKPAKLSRREQQLASLARELGTSKCFVNQPNYVKS
jgi:hypothetical protein